MMLVFSSLVLGAAWAAWLYPLLLRAPHKQARPSITLPGATGAGLALQCAGIAIALLFHAPFASRVAVWRIVAGAVLAAVCTVVSWTSVTHLGRQFRISAGLYDDHMLVRSGPFRYVRHPIYASMLGMVVCSALLAMTDWRWAVVALALYIAGTEVRVRAEDTLLESRFGGDFAQYRASTRAYIPFVR